MNISFQVRNTRTGRLVRTFGAADKALDWAKAHSEALGGLEAVAVEIITRERVLTETPVIPMLGARGLRAGRGRA
jgi:hypothetical protein